MTNDSTISEAAYLSLTALRRIDERTAQFEAAWNAAQPPRIEAFLEDAEEPERQALFLELLLSELELRNKRETLADEALYLTRFPQYGQVVREAFAAAEKSDELEADDLGFLEPSLKPGAIGRLGHFEVLEVVGRGGFGVVLRAFDEVLQRVVAIKAMYPKLATTSPPRKRFLREARAAGGIHHDNVVQIHAVEEQPIPYLVMEYIHGETLQQRLDRTGPLEPAEILRIGQHVASGLAAAHARQLIHRDVKPGNILLESAVEQRVKVSDFGLARTADDASLTQSGLIAGTPLFMAPEQVQGQAVDCRADLFSLGSVLYTMCVGHPPFRASTTLAVVRRVVDDTPRPICDITPEVPRRLVEIITKLHAKKPEDRFQSAKEVADLLARLLTELQAQGRLQDEQEGEALVPRPQSAPRSAGHAGGRRPAVSSRRWRILLGAVLLTGCAVLALTEATGFTALTAQVARLFAPPVVRIEPAKPEIVQDPPDKPDAPAPAIAPFDGVQARAHQEAWAKFLDTKAFTTNSIGMKLALIPPGEMHLNRFVGGQFSRQVAQPIYAGIHEVSVGQFRQFVKETGHRTDAEQSSGGIYFAVPHGPAVSRVENIWSHGDFAGQEDWPVSMITWFDAQAFCAWLGKKEERRYRLPTEAEWYWCAWAGGADRYYFGDDQAEMDQHAWNLESSEHQVHPVGSRQANPWGLFDVYGNVNELCFDWYRDGKPSQRVTTTEFPEGPGSADAIPVRGLSFHDPGKSPVNIGQLPPTWASSHIGFRVVVELPK